MYFAINKYEEGKETAKKASTGIELSKEERVINNFTKGYTYEPEDTLLDEFFNVGQI